MSEKEVIAYGTEVCTGTYKCAVCNYVMKIKTDDLVAIPPCRQPGCTSAGWVRRHEDGDA